MGVTGRIEEPSRHALSIGSQLLAIGSGFIVFVALVGLFAAIQKRRRGRNSNRDMHSPLIQTFNANRQKFRATSRTNFGTPSSHGGSPLPMLSPSSDSSNSPQCSPLTPYASFGGKNELAFHQANNDERGSMSLALNYDQSTKTLQLSIISCHNLPQIQNGQLNPYVKLRILPDNVHRGKTRVLRNTCNPFYDETFTMSGITSQQLKSYNLHVAVLSSDQFSRDTVLGEAFLGLGEAERCRDINDNEGKENNIELKLYPRPTYSDVRTQVFLSIAYNQMTNSVNLAVLKLKDLPTDECIGQIDSYVKVYMLFNKQRVAKHKTHVKKRCPDPMFNESFSFDLPSIVGNGSNRVQSASQILDAISFEVQVLNHNGITRSELIGSCLINNESKHWNEVKENPGQNVSEWYKVHAH